MIERNQEGSLEFPEVVDGEDKSSHLKNCLRKNYRHLRKWAKRTKTNAFRLYDRDIKEYPLIIDFYAGRYCIYYISFDSDVDEPPKELKDEVSEALTSLLNADENSIHWKTRKRRQKMEQYEKVDQTNDFFTVFEYGLKFTVNLDDYLDTGLFIDHREMRHIIGEISKGKRVLNLFAYTCSFSIHAAAGGALFTKSVDMSNTYTTWGRENFNMNALSLKGNEIVRADCMKFLDEEVERGIKYDIIIIDPPTLSRSKKMEEKFEVQVDYIFLISTSLKLLSKGGSIFFSTNSRKFVFDRSFFGSCLIEDITAKTLPLDIRKKKIHRCWKITI